MKKYFGFYYLVCRRLVTISKKSSIVPATVQKPRKKNSDIESYRYEKLWEK